MKCCVRCIRKSIITAKRFHLLLKHVYNIVLGLSFSVAELQTFFLFGDVVFSPVHRELLVSRKQRPEYFARRGTVFGTDVNNIKKKNRGLYSPIDSLATCDDNTREYRGKSEYRKASVLHSFRATSTTAGNNTINAYCLCVWVATRHGTPLISEYHNPYTVCTCYYILVMLYYIRTDKYVPSSAS